MDCPHDLKFAVVDVETSGGAGDQNRVTEIGILLLDGTEPAGEFHTLVDPGVPITPFVQNLTGITDEMVNGQPQFSKVPRLCTVKLSRKVFPGHTSYSLHNLTESLGLPDFNHHRAMADTLACAEILKMAYAKIGPEKILKEVKNLKHYRP